MSTPYPRQRRQHLARRYDAFSHSAQCDGFHSVISPDPGGVKHVSCACWCHSLQTLYASQEPEYDLSPPPEYATSADIYREPYNEMVSTIPTSLENLPAIYSDNDLLQDTNPILSSPIKYPNRSRQELTTNKCSTCGDTLSACECVE